MKNDESSEPTREEAVARWRKRHKEDTETRSEETLRNWVRRLITIAGVLVGAITGFGIACLIGFLIEVVTKPPYPDMMMAWWFIPVICIPLFAVLFGILSHRLGRRFPQAGCRHSDNGGAFDASNK